MTIARAAARRQFGAPVDGDTKELTGTEPADELALLSQSLVDLRVAIGAVSGEAQRAALVRELEQTRQAIADIETGHGHDPAGEDDAPTRPGMMSIPAGQRGQQGAAEAGGAKVIERPADVSEGNQAGERVADPTDRVVAPDGSPRRRWLVSAAPAVGVAVLLFAAFFGGRNAATLFDRNTAAESAESAASTGLDRSAETSPPSTTGDVDRSAPTATTAAADSEASTATTAPTSTTDPVTPTTPVAPVARAASARNDRTAGVGSELPDADPAPTPGSSSTTTSRQTTTAPSSTSTAAPATNPTRPATSPPTTQKPTTTAKPTTTTTQATTTTTTPGVPQLRSDFVEVEEDKNIKIYVLDNDQSGNSEFDEDTLTITSNPLHADDFRVHDDHLHYKSIEDYVGTDTIRYRVCNTNGLCAVANVTITVID